MQHVFQQTGVATLRKHHLPLEAVLWSIIGMSLFRRRSVWDIATQMDIMLPEKNLYWHPVQARQHLDSEAVKQVFLAMAKQSCHEAWTGLNLLAVDGVVWRTTDTPENHETFKAQSNGHSENIFPKVWMVCHMEVTSHQLINSALSDYRTSETLLAEHLIKQTARYDEVGKAQTIKIPI